MSEKTDRVGPIVFADETARSQLLEEGEVVTFRTFERTTGETWWRLSRTGEKQGDIVVEEIEAADPSHDNALEPYLTKSGFETVADWQQAIRSLNGDLEAGYLYRCTTGENDD